MVADQPRVVSERIADFFREFGIAIVSVILVTMLLLPMRVALVSAVAIPATISLTFGVLNAAGIELHQVSIAGLIVVLGMVVDDAIVIADNYVELLDHHVPVEDAAWRCATEMAVPVLAATITIIASFLPLLLLTGVVGEFIRALPITVSIALGVSFAVAMLLTPLSAKFFIRQGLHNSGNEPSDKKRSLLDSMQQYYNLVIAWALGNRKIVLVGAAAVFVVGTGTLLLVNQQFFPFAERDQFIIDVRLPEGARIEATGTAVGRIESALRSHAAVRSYTSFLGFSAPRFYYNVNPQISAPNYAQILVNTTGVSKTPKLINELRAQLPPLAPEAKVFVKELQQGVPIEAPVEIRISGDDSATLRSIGDQVESILNHTPGAIYTGTDWHEDRMLAGVNLDQEVANRLGLSNAAVANQLAAGFDGDTVTTFWEGDRDIDVDLRLDAGERQTFQNIADAYVQSPVTGAQVPVNAVASLSPEWHPGRIVRRNGVRTLTVGAFPRQGYLASQILGSASKQIAGLQLPQGYRIDYGGEAENQRDTFAEMRTALAISLVLIFVILLFQFRSLPDALIVMTAFPLALPGAAFGLFVTNNPFGFTAFIGIISLGGLVVRNSIILVDYIHERMKEGIALEQATLEAGERRLRPIFLTTMAAAVGVTPMIISRSSLWSPLASVIAFGLLGSMFFTLVAIPVLFVVVHSRKRLNPASGAAAAVALVALLAFPLTGRAQSRPVTLDEAVQMAMENNSTVRLAALKAQEADAKVIQARANYFPVVKNQSTAIHASQAEFLTIPAGALGVYSATGPIPGTNEKILLGKRDSILSMTTAAQPVSQMFKIHAGVSATKADTRIAHADLERARNEVSLNVKKLYYQLLAAEQRKVAAELRIQAGETRLEEARNAAESGVVLQVKVLQGQAEIADGRNQLGSLEDRIADMTNAFNDLVGLPLTTNTELIEPVDTKEKTQGKEADSVVPETEALTHNPEVLSARQTVVKARAGVDAAHAEYIPDISVFAQHVYQNGVPLLPDSFAAVGLRMDWTISEFGTRIGLVRERKAQLAEAKENLHATENKVNMEAQSEARKIQRSETSLKAARDSVAARAELLRIAGNQVAARTTTESDLKDAEAQLAEAKAQLFEAEMQRLVALAELARTEGRQ